MFEVQQNKQGLQGKRAAYSKFLSIKSINRNRKIVVKKSAPSHSFYIRNNNTFSTYEFGPKSECNEIATHRGFSNQKPITASNISNTNIINIKFSCDQSNNQRNNDHRMKRKTNNTFYFSAQEGKKVSLQARGKTDFVGNVQDTLMIQPLQKLENNFSVVDRKKGFFNCMVMSKKNRKGTKDRLIDRNDSMDFQRIGKQMTLAEIEVKKYSNLKPAKTSGSFRKKQLRNFQQDKQKEMKTISHAQKKDEKLEQLQIEEKEEKAKQRQITQALLRQFRQILPFRKPSLRKDYFVFGMSDKPNQPENKVQLYRDFIWKVNYSNGLYVNTPQNTDTGYKAYFGYGNNSIMVKSILKRRGWWSIVEGSSNIDNCHFVWTQLKINSLFKGQNNFMGEYEKKEIEQKPQVAVVDQNQQYFISHRKIFNQEDHINWSIHYKKHAKTEEKLTEQTYLKRIKLYSKKQITKIMDPLKIKVHNHLESNFYLGNKKALFYNIKRLCESKNESPFKFIPVTFHISKGVDDPAYERFLSCFKKYEEQKKIDKTFKNIWICKPGQNTNRGNGISVCSGIDDIRHRLRGREKNGDGKPRTFILQKYIEKPLLYKRRKFDIRHYMLLTCFNGRFKAYWFDQGYIRTSSSQFSLKNSADIMVHLTNDAVQKKCDSYGKHQKGNKVSYEDFQAYLDNQHKKKKYDFLGATLQRMKGIARTAVEATYGLLDPNRKQHNFELIGLDFMIDENFQPWLIEANTNPCLELSCPLLEKLIPVVIQQTFRICVDPFFPPPQNFTMKNKFFGENCLLENRYEIIFDEVVDGVKIERLLKENSGSFEQEIGKIEEDDQIFEDDGNEDWEQKAGNT